MKNDLESKVGKYVRITRKKGLIRNKQFRVYEGTLLKVKSHVVVLSGGRYHKGDLRWVNIGRGTVVEVIER